MGQSAAAAGGRDAACSPSLTPDQDCASNERRAQPTAGAAVTTAVTAAAAAAAAATTVVAVADQADGASRASEPHAALAGGPAPGAVQPVDNGGALGVSSPAVSPGTAPRDQDGTAHADRLARRGQLLGQRHTVDAVSEANHADGAGLEWPIKAEYGLVDPKAKQQGTGGPTTPPTSSPPIEQLTVEPVTAELTLLQKLANLVQVRNNAALCMSKKKAFDGITR